jgi:hypothetical protein
MKSGNFYYVLTFVFLLVSACSTSRSAVAPASSPAEKKMEAVDPYMGTWSYEVADTPMGTVTGDMVINKNAEGYEGYLENEMGKTPLYNFKVMGNALDANFDYEGYQISVKGNFEGESFKGEMGAESMVFPMKAERKK